MRFASLTTAHKEFIQSRKLDTAMTAEEWIAFLNPLAAVDRAGDAKRGPIGCASGLLFLGAIVTAVIGLYPVAGIVLIASVVLLVMWVRLKKHDVPNALRTFVLPLVAVLREDVDGNAPIHLRLDLTGGTSATKKQRTEVLNNKGYPKVSQDYYSDPWMSGEAKLVDGSLVSWEIVDDIRERSVTKRNARGKVKHKIKYRVRRTMDARVALAREDYMMADVAASQRAAEIAIKVKEGDKRNVVQLRKRSLATTIDTSPEVSDLLGLITGAYARVSPNRGGSRQ